MKQPVDRQPLHASEIRELLRAADPCRRGTELSGADAARLRRAVLAEARERSLESPARAGGHRLLPGLAAALLILVAGTYAWLLRSGGGEPRTAAFESSPVASGPPPARGERGVEQEQQLQFVTASGTRVIWVLSSDLDL